MTRTVRRSSRRNSSPGQSLTQVLGGPAHQRAACRGSGGPDRRRAGCASFGRPDPRRPAPRQHRRHAKGAGEAARRGAGGIHRRRRRARRRRACGDLRRRACRLCDTWRPRRLWAKPATSARTSLRSAWCSTRCSPGQPAFGRPGGRRHAAGHPEGPGAGAERQRAAKLARRARPDRGPRARQARRGQVSDGRAVGRRPCARSRRPRRRTRRARHVRAGTRLAPLVVGRGAVAVGAAWGGRSGIDDCRSANYEFSRISQSSIVNCIR